MAEIQPFAAVRPAPDKAPFVVSRSLEEYSPAQRDALMSENPFSFLHILRPGFTFGRRVSGAERHDLIRNRYLEFLDEGIFLQESSPCLYLYRQSQAGYSCAGIFCATPTEAYVSGGIRRHEDTLQRREQLFADYLEQVRFNAEPVLLTYPDHPGVAAELRRIQELEPEYRFTTPDRITHEMWVVDQPETIRRIGAYFKEVAALYIADGHHRCASSALLAQRLQASEPKNLASNYFMSYLIPESEVRIHAFSRLLTDLGGLKPADVLIRLDAVYRIREKGRKPYLPSKKHHFSLYLDDRFYALYLRKPMWQFTDPVSSLDTHILYRTVLKPIFGISDPRNDPRLQYCSGDQGAALVKSRVDSGDFACGFAMLPATMEEIRAVADQNLTMPPKSTYMEPKLRSGFTIYNF